ncbi:MAG: two-component system sensor histidine kinase QseC [Arenicella sp.]|jgi:two-component system sensor histidine kinase QseC
MKSIRLYLIIVLLSTICIVNFGAALNGYTRSADAGRVLLDKRLVDMAKTTTKLYKNHATLDAETFESNVIFQLWDDDKLVAKSENAPITAIASSRSDFHIVNSNGVQWRVIWHQDPGSNIVTMYGERYDLYRKLIDGIILESILPIVWVLPIIATLVWLIVGYGLRPLKQFADKLHRQSANDLSTISTDGLPAELSSVVESTNTLFARLSEAFEREQRFAADAAHELRTPLAALKISLHNHAQGIETADENIADLQASAKRMEASIEQILALCRLAPETFRRTLTECNLKTVAQMSLINVFSALEEKHQTVELIGEDIKIEGDEFALSMLLKNLLENASKYTPDSGDITLTIKGSDDASITIIVQDSGPGIPASDYQRVFDRFYRLGGDRHTSGVTGSGLGLSIVSHVVRLHGGEIKLSESPSLGGLAVTVTLPKVQLRRMDL